MSKLSDYRSMLLSQGLRPQVHDDFIAFAYEKGNYVLEANDQDPEFFRLLYPNFWRIESPLEQVRATTAAGQVTSMVKVAKVYPVRRFDEASGQMVGDVSAAVDLLLPDGSNAGSILSRALQTLQVASQTFAVAMASSLPLGDWIDGLQRDKHGEPGSDVA